MARSAATGILALAFCLAMASARADCHRNQSGVFEDVACASEALADADRRLNETYKQLLGTLDADAKLKLKAAQRAWLQYRDTHVGFVYSVEGEGSAGRTVVANDRERQTRARIKELSSWLPKR
jgi:uncharacterized protein YecT (DUF1311 family)